jgi:hypothetical protein
LAYSQIQAPCGLKVAPETHLFLVGYDREFLGMKPHGSIVAPTRPEPLLDRRLYTMEHQSGSCRGIPDYGSMKSSPIHLCRPIG